MTSMRNTSNKSRRDRSASDGSSSQHENVVPKVAFAEHSIDPEEAMDIGRPRATSCPNGLDTIWSFCGVPESVEFCLPVVGDVSESPPDGYFTCFEEYLMQCHLWFPMLEAVVQLFGRFGLAIDQVSPRGLQHVVRILVLSYERCLPLDVDHLEVLLMPVGSSATIQLSPRHNIAIIAGFVLNYHDWKKFLFFVRIDNASVEESCIPILRTRWVTNPLPPTPDGLCTLRDLLRSGVSYWASFTPKRVHHAVALHCFQFRPDLPVEEGKESSMEGFIPWEAPAERRRSRTCKDKHIAVDGDAAGVKFFPEYILGDYLNRGEPIDIDGLLRSDVLAAEGGFSKGTHFTKASRMVNGQALSTHFFYGQTFPDFENFHRAFS
ncbi:hypothetical protein F2Q70_00017294 [Brassica cretica]|uniref:Uncharacterized protein n=1 Tax=Brassica cretica TaxID=69181 RepID=A0A8S9I1D9_BRACR|nr:hypothetical protein F2Q70_00017294 [Brassica cretica]KAF2595589.1 hypothetical protein F2Q68_00010248 [Brassica cretica]